MQVPEVDKDLVIVELRNKLEAATLEAIEYKALAQQILNIANQNEKEAQEAVVEGKVVS